MKLNYFSNIWYYYINKKMKINKSNVLNAYQIYSSIYINYISDYGSYNYAYLEEEYNIFDDNYTKYELYIIAILQLYTSLPPYILLLKKYMVYINENIEYKDRLIISKYIYKTKYIDDEKYILINILYNFFNKYILYETKRGYIIYIHKQENKYDKLLINEIKNNFIKLEKEIIIYWHNHFNVIDNNELAKIDETAIF